MKRLLNYLSAIIIMMMVPIGSKAALPTNTADGLYLIGNFFNTDGSSINTTNRIFKFEPQTNGTYKLDFPATITANVRLVNVVNGTATQYAPSSDPWITAGTVSSSGSNTQSLTANSSHYWQLYTRNDNSSEHEDDGIYEISVTLSSEGVPTSCTFKHDPLRRVAYFISTEPGATAQPVYDSRNNTTSDFSNKTWGRIRFNSSYGIYVIGNVVHDNESATISLSSSTYGTHVNLKNESIRPTTNKLFFEGNGGRIFQDSNPFNEVSPNEDDIRPTNKTTGLYTVEYNPSNGSTEDARNTGNYSNPSTNNHLGIRGQIILKSGGEDDPITSVSMVGPAIAGTTSGDTWIWDSTEGDMTWDATERCYKLTLNTSSVELGKHFRFVINHTQAKNLYETGNTARIPYTDTQEDQPGTVSCTDTEPNDVAYTTSGTSSYTSSDYDILFNRPAGTWTVRLYMVTHTINNNTTRSYYYTIDGEENTTPDATLYPGTDGGNYDFDNYTKGTAETLTVTLSNATKYAYAIGANSDVALVESSTKTNGSFTLTYDGTKVTDGFNNEVTGNTVYVKIQGQDDSGNKGTTHTYQYTFNVSTLDFTPKSGFFINKAVITVTNGTAPYTYTIKDASDNVLSTGTSSTATFTISTPGKLTVTDKNGNSATSTSTEIFDFTYSTSENYANYYNNGTTAQSVAQEGGADATNIFLKKADYENMRIYAWDYTYDQKIQAYQRGETTDIDDEIAALKSPAITKSSVTTYDNDGNKDQGDKTWNLTAPGYAERDPHVMLTEPYPGTLMSDSRTIEIDGETYYYLTLPLSRLHKTTYDVGIIMTRNDENPANMSQNADLYKTADNEIKGNSSFIYSSSEDTRFATPTGDNVVFYTNPNNWSSVKVYMWNGSGGEGNQNAEWGSAPAMTQSGSVYYYAPTQKWENVIFYDGNNDSNKTPTMGYGGGRYYYDNANEKKTTYVNKFYDISELVEPNGNIIFFDNSKVNWSNVYCYAWKDGNASQQNAAWPGVLMADYGNDMYIEEVDPTLYDRIQFNNGSSKTPDISDFGSGKYVYTYDGSSVNKTVKTVNQDRYNTYITTPSTYTVEVQNHPNGDDYLRAMPSDKTVLLDPTWGGVITPKEVADEETSVPSWNGVEGNTVGYRKIVTQNLTQTIYGLDNSKTYTVQAIVRVWDGKTVTLKVGDGTAVSSAAWGASGIAHVNKNGRVDERYTAGPDPDDPYFLHVGGNTAQGYGWQKIEASGNPTKAGNLVITLTNSDNTQQYDLADVVLLENANTAGNYWTKLPTDATSVASIKAGEIDMQDRSTYNAFSFFDRDNGNPNAMIKASNRTVIGLNSGIAYVQNSNENVLDDVDHRQSRNTISLNADGTTWSGRYLYLYDESSDWTDCNAYGATVDFNMIGAKYDRQFTANQHSTLFLPFAVTTEQLKTAGFKELQMVDVDNVNSANIPLITWDLTKETPTTYTTTAGQGYIVIAGSNGASLSSFIKPTGGIDVQAANSEEAKKTEATGLVGAYVYGLRYQTEDADGTTYMNYSYLNDKFRALATAAQGGAEIKPFRATFAVPNSVVNGARTLSVSFIDAEDAFTPTGVDKLGVEEQLSGNIYTLDGRLVSTNGKLSELSRGIYVRGGRKIVVK